jgi:hypothetical protein
MLRWILISSLFFCFLSCIAQSKKDSIRVVIALDAANDKIERSHGYWEARAALDVKMDMYGFVGGKHLYKTFDMIYDPDEKAWVVMLPKGYFELRVESLGFSTIKFPFRLKKDHREEFDLKLDSVSYSYLNRERFNYIAGTLNFNETILVQFSEGEFADNRAFLMEALALEGLEHLNVLRVNKVPYTNAFLVTLDIADRTPLNMILYRKMTNLPLIERGYIIGGDVTKAIELFQINPNVVYANPSFLDDPDQKFRTSANFTKSDKLDNKLLRLMEQDTRTLDKINYIIDKTTTKKKVEDNLE